MFNIDFIILLIFFSIIIFLVYVVKQIKKFFILNKIVDWESYFKYILDVSYDIVYIKHIIVYKTSNMSLNPNEGEYLTLINIFTQNVDLNLGRLKNDIYFKYIFKNKDDYFDKINLYFYIKIQEDLIEKEYNDFSVIKNNNKEENIGGDINNEL